MSRGLSRRSRTFLAAHRSLPALQAVLEVALDLGALDRGIAWADAVAAACYADQTSAGAAMWRDLAAELRRRRGRY